MGKAKIFIVENEPIQALDLKDKLSTLGYPVCGSAMTGEECLAGISSDPPDLIIMDLMLRGRMDGIETAAEIRKRHDIPVVFATLLSERTSLSRAKLTEPYGYIIKPYNERELFTTIEMSLYKHDVDRKFNLSKLKYGNLFENSRDAIFTTDGDWGITNVNRALLDLTGYDFLNLIGRSVWDLVGGSAEAILSAMQEHGYVGNCEFILKGNEGLESECILTCSRIAGSGAEALCYQGIIHDISINKRLERLRDRLFDDKVKRVKELNCLYRLADVSGSIDTPLDDLFRQIVEIIPESFQHPDLVSARLIYKGREILSAGFIMNDSCMASPFSVFGETVGSIEIFSNALRADSDKNVFTIGDRDLMHAIAERLGIIIERKLTFEELHESRQKLRNLTSHLQKLRESERTHIAREIHDIMGQSLTALKMDLSWIRNRMGGEEKAIIEKLGSTTALVDETIDTVRRIASELRPGLLDDLGLYAAIEWHAGDFQKRNDIACRVSGNTADLRLDEMISITIYRIFQESLTNIARHAHATQVEVSLMKHGDSITLTVHDNGRGIEEKEISNPHSLGLIGIRERAYSCNGSIIISGARGSGTTVEASFPLAGGGS
jgi:PAS domain S-box-containing protein